MNFRNIREYFESVQSLVSKYKLGSEIHKIRLLPRSKYSGLIITKEPHIVFADKAILQFMEVAEIKDGKVTRGTYSYQYKKANYYFRYDKDPIRAVYPHHALCHLHVNSDDPRYISHETSFEEIFKFVIACFYETP